MVKEKSRLPLQCTAILWIVAGTGLGLAVGCNAPSSHSTPTEAELISTEVDGLERYTGRVEIYEDPGGCQYLIFRDLGPTQTATPRLHSQTSGACMASKVR